MSVPSAFAELLVVAIIIMSSLTGLSMTSSISLVSSTAATDSHSIGSEGGLTRIAELLFPSIALVAYFYKFHSLNFEA